MSIKVPNTKKKFLNKHVTLLLLLCLFSIPVVSQPVIKQVKETKSGVRYFYVQKDSNTIIFDPLDTLSWQPITNDDFAFLYSDSVYYDCKVHRIDNFKEGYGVLVGSIIDSIPVYGYIISAKNKDSKKGRIKVGKKYKMKLVRYFEKPVSRPIERRPIYDVLIDTNVISVFSTGSFCYLFVSPNLIGLSYIEPILADSIEFIKKKKEIELNSFIYEFISSISNKKDTLFLKQYVDTILLSKMLKKYSSVYPSSPSSTFKRPPRDIEYLPWSNFDIDDSRFESLFWGMLGSQFFYKLPKDSLFFIEEKMKINSLKILCLNENIITVRVKWSIPNQKKEYQAEISIKETLGNYKVVGFNQTNEHYK